MGGRWEDESQARPLVEAFVATSTALCDAFKSCERPDQLETLGFDLAQAERSGSRTHYSRSDEALAVAGCARWCDDAGGTIAGLDLEGVVRHLSVALHLLVRHWVVSTAAHGKFAEIDASPLGDPQLTAALRPRLKTR